MVLPVGVGVDCRVFAAIIAPFVNLALGKARGLSVGYQSRILNLHEVGIIGHKI